MISLLFLFGCVSVRGFRNDPTRSLIDIQFEHASTSRVANLLDMPSWPCDEEEWEYVNETLMQIWVTEEHLELLASAGINNSPGHDEAAASFAEEKAQNYTDPTNGDPPDWGKYCGYDCCITRFEALAKNCKYPVVLEDYGKSVRGRRLIALKIGTKMPAKGPVLQGGNIHGDEPVGNQMIQRYAWETCNSPDATQAKIAEGSVTWYLPYFNPDGYESNQRANANGVDLNRNFPVIKKPRAEVEVTSYMTFATKVKPSYSTMYHGGLCAALYPYFSCYDKTVVPKCPPGDVGSNNPRAQDFKTATTLYAAGMMKGPKCSTSNCKFNVINDGGYPGTGILADWAANSNGQVDITVEVDKSKKPSGSRLPYYYGIHKPIIDGYNQLPL